MTNTHCAYGITSLAVGTRVALHPATDAFMRGRRYAELVTPCSARSGKYGVRYDDGQLALVHARNVREAS